MNKEMTELLRQWGQVYGERPPREADAAGGWATAAHALESAGSSLTRRARRRPRWRTYEDSSGKWRREVSPPHVCFGRETRSYAPPAPRADRPEIAAVEAAAQQLLLLHRPRGIVLRQDFCTRGPRSEKAERSGVLLGLPMTLRMYRRELDHALIWMEGALSITIPAWWWQAAEVVNG